MKIPAFIPDDLIRKFIAEIIVCAIEDYRMAVQRGWIVNGNPVSNVKKKKHDFKQR